jgi:serine protease Do
MKRNAVAWAALVVSAAALVSSRGFTRVVPAAPEIPAETQKTARAMSEAFGAVADFVRPSVVQISVERKASAGPLGRGGRMPFPGLPDGPHGNIDPKDFEEMFKRFFPEGRLEKQQFSQRAEGTGSGFIYDDKGHILTNNHVVAGSGKINVTFHDGIEATATIVGTDPDSDVAVIKVDNTNYRPLPKGSSSKLRVGELIMAVGSPFGLSQSVTTGIISATERNVVGINKYESFLQTDAAINPGNSGGPMVDMQGRVVGINSAIVTGSRGNDGVGFAIPIDMADTIAGKLIKDGKVNYARVGIKLGVLTPALAKQFGLAPDTKGVVADEVLPGSPADKAGLQAGDVITSFDGKPVLSVPTFRLRVASSDVGKPFNMTYFRGGKEHTTSVTPAAATQVLFAQEREGAETPESARVEPPKAEIKGFGFEVQPLTSELAGQFGLDKDVKGLLISSVKEGSPAEAAGLEEGMVITKVVQEHEPRPVPELKEFQSLVGKADMLTVHVQTKEGARFVTLTKAKAD